MKLWSIIHHFTNNTDTASVDTSPVQDVSLPLYMGRWYEQARYENWFEQDMDEVYADYTPGPDGSIIIRNSATDKHGQLRQSRGKATLGAGGALLVSFVPPYFWFRAQYNILHLAPDYSAALVSGKGDACLWLLTRARRADTRTMHQLLKAAQRRGFDTARLRPTWQSP